MWFGCNLMNSVLGQSQRVEGCLGPSSYALFVVMKIVVAWIRIHFWGMVGWSKLDYEDKHQVWVNFRPTGGGIMAATLELLWIISWQPWSFPKKVSTGIGCVSLLSPFGTMRYKDELGHGANNGLDIAVRLLEPIK
ncbi:hypothetical protein E3N88_19309 [Mikania micrantha]|uniref:Uncharacterized protein n=1 Tax=Mikania micrantha TaxID=192012 RepID=A0A5N6NPS4_9ASTR|nr:hypothetical protein E3N88_19309 [Mikania micrantha]